MSVNFGGLQQVKLSVFFECANQLGMIDRTLCAFNPLPGVLWNSADLFTQMFILGFHNGLRDAISIDAKLVGYKLYQKSPGQPPLIATDSQGAGLGTGPAGVLPKQCAGLISFKSSIGGPQGRGRVYMPFPSGTWITAGGNTSGVYDAALTTVANSLLDGWTINNVGSGGGILTVKPCTKFTLGASGIPLAYDSGVPANGFATQKRRGFFGKPNSIPVL